MSVRYYDWIAHFGRRTPDKIAAIDLGSSRRFCYAEFDARSSRLAMHLRDELKVARGDRVAVLASMHPWAIAFGALGRQKSRSPGRSRYKP